jgi:hypothetical protein
MPVRYSFLVLTLICFLQSFSQPGQNPFFSCKVIEKDARVDSMHWQAYLDQHLQMDQATLDTIPSGVYILTVVFLINKDGCISDIKILNNPGYELGQKASEVISAYQQWIPAERNGRKVRAFRKQVLTIKIRKEKCEENLSAKIML